MICKAWLTVEEQQIIGIYKTSREQLLERVDFAQI